MAPKSKTSKSKASKSKASKSKASTSKAQAQEDVKPNVIIKFSKYHANGNDLIIVDNLTGEYGSILDNPQVINAMCCRRTGIGSDGLVEIKKTEGYVFEMVFYLSCGWKGSFEGNAGRCTLAYLYDMKVIPDEITFLASDGLHLGSYNQARSQAMVGFGDLADPVVLTYDEFFFDTGCPHHVVFLQDPATLEAYDVEAVGKEICDKEQYMAIGGTNVDFVVVDYPLGLRMRAFDRGVRSEVMSSGSGAVACALAHETRSQRLDEASGWAVSGTAVGMRELDRATRVGCLYGEMEVRYRHARGTDVFHAVHLLGPVWSVYSGAYKVPREHASNVFW